MYFKSLKQGLYQGYLTYCEGCTEQVTYLSWRVSLSTVHVVHQKEKKKNPGPDP